MISWWDTGDIYAFAKKQNKTTNYISLDLLCRTRSLCLINQLTNQSDGKYLLSAYYLQAFYGSADTMTLLAGRPCDQIIEPQVY